MDQMIIIQEKKTDHQYFLIKQNKSKTESKIKVKDK
jgi:hypothetical protein